MIKFELHLPINEHNSAIIEILSQHCQQYSLSINQLKSAILKGALWLSRGKSTQRIRKVKKALQENDVLHFYYDQAVLAQSPLPAQLIADCNQYSIWYKPYGMLSQGSKWSDHCTIARWAETQLQPQRPAFIVHRLDRAASGLMVIAHSKKMAQAFSKMFETRALEKRYHIIVHGHLLEAQQILSQIDNNQENPELSSSQLNNTEKKGTKVSTPIDGKNALSTFYPLEYQPKEHLSLLEVKIETGRKHQIRKHAASINLPVVGDRLHGDKERAMPDEIHLQLCSVKLAFVCPVEHIQKSFELPVELKPNLIQLADNMRLLGSVDS